MAVPPISTPQAPIQTVQGEKIPNSAFDNINSSLTQASQLLTNYLVSPLQKLGLGGFLFDKVVNSNLSLKAEYTQNFVEKGSYITDHVIFQPKTITMTGYVGEKTFSSTANVSLLNQLTQKLTTIVGLTPTLTTGMSQLKSGLEAAQAGEIQNTVNNGIDFWNSLKLLNPPKTKVGQAYNYFTALFNSSTVLSLTEPDGTYHINMVITGLSKKTREETLDIVDFIVELQEFRTADTLYNQFDIDNWAGRAGEANSDTTNQGKVQGVATTKTPTSILSSIVNPQKPPQ